jgi:hypothetical protein
MKTSWAVLLGFAIENKAENNGPCLSSLVNRETLVADPPAPASWHSSFATAQTAD